METMALAAGMKLTPENKNVRPGWSSFLASLSPCGRGWIALSESEARAG